MITVVRMPLTAPAACAPSTTEAKVQVMPSYDNQCPADMLAKRIFNQSGVPVKRYTLRRGATSTTNSVPASLGRGVGVTVLAPVPGTPTEAAALLLDSHNPPQRRPPTIVDLLLQLDSHRVPGLNPQQIRQLLIGCSGCGLIMTRRAAASFHVCHNAATRDAADGTEADSNAI
ncbi:hypothetical protein BV25DRAFT_1840961 [Artomyces pyxidatus]|uniref:Uncharacterized protein n=1 Tax=Artomyces pyxidatus TaxID=48021 RepID=A0ACB8SR51_9AGAM|nr:hypothetical protein BV25DRAFT_1840961 [Artomyces pyxidatus]